MPGRPKTFLFLIRSGPIPNGMADEMIDAALTAASFGQDVRIAFADDGLFRLLALTPGRIRELAEHDVETVCFERESLAERGVDPVLLPSLATPLSRAEITHLIADADVAFSS